MVSEATDHLLRRTKRASYSSIKAKLQKALRTKSIPDEMTKIVSAIVKAVDIDKCIPTVKKGNCYTSKTFCDVKTKEFNTAIKLTICKKPWSLKIDFKIPKDFKSKVPRILKPFLFVDVKPIVLKLDHKKTEGITKVRHNARIATAGLKILFIKLRYIKVYFIFELTVRWDCTRPRSDHLERLKYNRDYSDGKKGNDMNKHYYKLKIRYEIKKRNPFSTKYKCKKCKTILDKKGHLTYGPKKCKSGQIFLHYSRSLLICSLKDICGYFQCAPFPRLQTGKVVWVLSFDP